MGSLTGQKNTFLQTSFWVDPPNADKWSAVLMFCTESFIQLFPIRLLKRIILSVYHPIFKHIRKFFWVFANFAWLKSWSNEVFSFSLNPKLGMGWKFSRNTQILKAFENYANCITEKFVIYKHDKTFHFQVFVTKYDSLCT